jgi:hypothetical protein
LKIPQKKSNVFAKQPHYDGKLCSAEICFSGRFFEPTERICYGTLVEEEQGEKKISNVFAAEIKERERGKEQSVIATTQRADRELTKNRVEELKN